MNFTRIGLVPWDNLGLLKFARSSLTQILVAIQDLIVSSGYYSQSQVSITLEKNPFPTKSGPFVLIRPGRHHLIPGQWSGSGGYLAGYHGWIPITIVDQCMLDSRGGGDEFALLRSSVDTDSPRSPIGFFSPFNAPVEGGTSAIITVDQGLFDQALQLSEFLTGEVSSKAMTQTGLVQTPLGSYGISDPKYLNQKEKRWREIVLTITLDWTHVYQQNGF